MKTNFTALDFIVLVTYLIATTVLGIWLGRNQKDSKDYFVAGHRIPWWAVLFSVVATETSALTFISIPGGALAWTNWIAGIVAVYSSLFGIGKLVLGNLVEGLVMLAIAAAAFSWIARSFRQEPATLPGVGVPA